MNEILNDQKKNKYTKYSENEEIVNLLNDAFIDLRNAVNQREILQNENLIK